ncbi:hypothetical protein [Polyangium jinanense]|uniref:Uncharacterized protein n=1 Tax=Polyangium jinanense TaxID=2829994 RepID=A0A9X3WXN6_9BACT|nr:hypothetical protein [Polyangium jinanense]MDC3952589.1 hypothetical protein [Polyangium jinanense]MDC3980217.1 hypothetical protein [Polyangium jinanense]
MRTMILCSACKRHVFSSEPSCPFCGLELDPAARKSKTPALSPEMSRAQRYALGAAMAMTLAGTACKTEDSPAVEPESAENATASAAPLAPPEPPRPTPQPEDRAREAPPPPSPFLVGAPTNDPPPLPELPQRVDVAPADAGALDAGRTVARKPPPPPPPPLDDPPDGWRRNHRCIRTPNGGMNCPPYGCVFPDEACDTFRV